MQGKTLMVQGTSSSVGKSILVTALCRILKQDGYSVAPFKAQNMALNSFVTREGGEIGRSQVCQAEAAGVEPSVDMNPILLKPQADATSQVIVLGKASATSHARDYYKDNFKYLPIIEESLKTLTAKYDVVLIEGAGSPAEINLMDREIANMRIALLAKAPVLLVGDIDRGGVFASIVGTMALLPARQRSLVRGFIINKFRGDLSLLKPALDFLEKRYSRPVLGVVPYIRDIGIAQEDSVYLDERSTQVRSGRADVCIIRLPHISNYDDFDPLEITCNVSYVSSCKEMGDPDVIILPGTKSTMSDLHFLRQSGFADTIVRKAVEGTPVIGICGGYQMLGRKIYDHSRAESDLEEADGLGLLEMTTNFEQEKVTSQVTGSVIAGQGLLRNMSGVSLTGYEIHMGRSEAPSSNPAFKIGGAGSSREDGEINEAGTVFGTYLHGLFNSSDFTRRLIENLCNLRGIEISLHSALNRQKAYDDLAASVRENVNMGKIYEIISGGVHG
jgi:adenosylcobyric acid synthase